MVATWENRTVTFTGNRTTATVNGINDQTGIPVTIDVKVGIDEKLVINAGSTGLWWLDGHNGEIQTFFKVDNFQLKCKMLYMNALALPLPNDNSTQLNPGFWYYYDCEYLTNYQLIGNINGMVYSTDGEKTLASVSTAPAARQMTLEKGRYYFKTTQSNVTLQISPERQVEETGTFTAVALNVDGLPNTVATIELNPDGPGADGTVKISKYLKSKGYDFIGCSEDFNYNGSLMSALEEIGYSCGKIRKTLSISGLSGGLPFDTDGLNLLWNTNTVSAANETWKKWNDTESTDGNQYVKKGYRHYDMTFQGVTFDVYILHMDAGDTNATWSRHSQWQQLAGAINSADASRPKLVIGDTNSRWTREDITANFMNQLNSNLKASDVWVEFYRNGIYPTTDMADLTDAVIPENYSNYEIVDKIIYINPTTVNTPQLVPLNFRIEQDYTYGNVDGTDDTTPLGDHRPVVVEFKILKAGDVSPVEIVLPNDGTNNNTVVEEADEALANVTLSGRSFIKDNEWNTLCLPFSIDNFSGTPLDGATVMTLESSDFADNTLELNFSEATAVDAGVPFFVKWSSAESLSNPVFSNVVIDNSLTNVQTTYADFVGSYIPVDLEANDKSVLYLSDASTLYYPNDAVTVGACHAYFTLKEDLYAGEPANQVNTFVLNFGDSVSGVENLQWSMHNGEWSMDNGQWYTINGVKLQGKPTERGLYIHGKTKVLIK